MPRKTYDDMDRMYDDRSAHYERTADWKTKGLRFVRYLSTRKIESWGFFIAGLLIGGVIL